MLSGKHDCIGFWRINEEDSYIDLAEVRPLLNSRSPVLIPHKDIAWWSMEKPKKKIDTRYYNCNIRIPGIVADGVKNPYNKRYRMVDGAHRMARMLLETNIRESLYYVITEEEFYRYVRSC